MHFSHPQTTTGYLPFGRVGRRTAALDALPASRTTAPGPAGFVGPARKTLLALLCAGAMLALVPSPSGAITGGQPDESRHPQVGGTVLRFPDGHPNAGETIVNCTGTLIAPKVFLTAAHCGRPNTQRSITFDEVFDASSSTTYPGTFLVHPDYDPAQQYHNDLAVIVLKDPIEHITPARLPEAGLLDGMKAAGTLNQATRFTSVGYGFLGFTNGAGGMTRIRGQARHYAVGSFNALAPEQLHLSQNAALQDGGTCNGDSGGPNFLGAGSGETDIIAGVTSTGDTYCKATNVTYRVDTQKARAFLGQHVTLP